MKKLPSLTLAALLLAPLAALFALPLIGCKPTALGPGPSDFSAALVGRYTLNRTSAHQVYISLYGGLGDDVPKIPAKVLECAVHKNLILAKRQGLKRRSPNDPNDTYEEPDLTVFDYWILDTTGVGRVFGPLTSEQFNAKQRELGVFESVTLKDVYSYRK